MGCFDAPELDSSDTVVQDEFAKISREQFDDYTSRYESTLTDLVGDAMNPDYVGDRVDESVSGISDQFRVAGENINRTNERYRVQLTPRQQRAQQAMLKSGQVTARDDAANRTRIDAADQQDRLRDSVISIGQGMRGESLNNFSSVAGLENQRAQSNLAADARHQQGKLNLVGQAVGAGSLLMLSDRTKKHAVVKADTESHLKEVLGLKLKQYEYNEGIDPEPKRRTGVMYQDTPSLQAPKQNGRVLDLGDWNAKNSGAIQELAKNIERVERVLQLRAA